MPVPKRGKKYQEVVDRGCGGWVDYWGEYTCDHDYDWTCDECPCSIEARKTKPPVQKDEEFLEGWK